MVVLAVSVLGLGCATKDDHRAGSAGAPGVSAIAPFHIVATDAGFIAPESVPAGRRHIVYENRGREIHEAMLVKLPPEMSPEGYVDALEGGNLFPKGWLDYSGPGLMSPGETTELWITVDPGRYILICWNSNHATHTPVHAFTVRADVVDDLPPKEDVVLKLVDYHFEIVGALTSGSQVIKIENAGPSMHEADLFRLDEGRTVGHVDLGMWRLIEISG